jgi:HSP20 family molecular chaperone IbpA
MSALLSEVGSVHVRETAEEFVVEVSVPAEVDLSQMSARRVAGVLEIRVPRLPRRHHGVQGFHPEATGV